MEPVLCEFNSVEAFEILYFENAQIEKVKGEAISFAAIGTLSVLYFKQYDRFVLQINDWRYPLLRRLPIVSDSNNTYILPGLNDFSYRLTLDYVPNLTALMNFDKILRAYSNFTLKGQDTPFRQSEISPDDKLARHTMKNTGVKEMLKETIKLGVGKAKIMAKTVETGTLHLESKKKMVHLKDLKNKNYKKRAHTTFSKNFFEAGQKITGEFVRERTGNVNMLEVKELKDLKVGYHLPRMYVNKDELENHILDNRELGMRGHIHLSGFDKPRGRTVEHNEKHTGFVDSLKQGLKEIKETFNDIVKGPNVTQSAAGQGPMERHEVTRNLTSEQLMNQYQMNTTNFSNMSHYQG